MKKILPPQKGVTGKDRKLPEEAQESIHPSQYEENITDGAEFMDDSIRMKDQPFGGTTENENE